MGKKSDFVLRKPDYLRKAFLSRRGPLRKKTQGFWKDAGVWLPNDGKKLFWRVLL